MNLHAILGKIALAAKVLGGPGLFLISFLDSSVLTFPVINDFLLVELSFQNPVRMPFYALMATFGSVAGCVLLYFIARKGGEALFHRHAGPHATSVKAWIEHNGFISVLVAALLPPPTPFKVFVIAAGVFELPLRSFVTALTLARALRYFGVGFLAVRYGELAKQHLKDPRFMLTVTGIVLALVLLSYALAKFFVRRHPRSS